jgi:hypothetical protein
MSHAPSRNQAIRIALSGLVAVVFGVASAAAEEKPAVAVADKPITLFDGKTLAGWKVTEFGGQGDVTVVDGTIVLEMGSNMTGITIADTIKILKIDYEITLEAMRIDGDDFFCGLTFPVNDKTLSFIVGGWGGSTVGISSLNGADASSNETSTYQDFDRNKWYKIRLAVTQKKLQAWIGEKKVVDVELAGKELSIRSEVALSKPLGFSTWLTKAALRNITIRPLPPAAK